MKVDLSSFNATVRKVAIESRKEMADVMNKNAIKALIGSKGSKGAVHFTKKATPGGIRKDLNKKYHVAGRVRGGKSGSDVKLLYIMAAKWLKSKGVGKGMSFEQWRGAVADAATRIYNARKASIAYIAAGWLNAVRDLGRAEGGGGAPRNFRTIGKVKSGGMADKSYAVRATPRSLRFLAVNAAVSDGGRDWWIANSGLMLGIRDATRDMNQYLVERQERILKKHSDKK